MMPEVVGSDQTVGGSRPVWEYKVFRTHARHDDQLEACLTEHGQAAWELVFMTEPVANEFRCVFRRQSR